MSVPTELRLRNIALCGRVLGQLFSAPPGADPCRSLLTTMADSGWINEWPYGELSILRDIAELLASGRDNNADETPDEAYQR
jgi:TorA maturation chaperone TorD